MSKCLPTGGFKLIDIEELFKLQWFRSKRRKLEVYLECPSELHNGYSLAPEKSSN